MPRRAIAVPGPGRAKRLVLTLTSLSDAELVALLFDRPSSVPLRKLRQSGLELAVVADCSPEALSEQFGLSESYALRLSAAFELGRRSLARPMDREPVLCFEQVVAWARPRLGALEHEEVWLLCLDGRNRLRSARRVAQGGLHGCAIYPRDILRPALRDGASSIVLVHNHPSGDPEPSDEDRVMTRELAALSQALGVPLLDHVIVSREGAASVLDPSSIVALG